MKLVQAKERKIDSRSKAWAKNVVKLRRETESSLNVAVDSKCLLTSLQKNNVQPPFSSYMTDSDAKRYSRCITNSTVVNSKTSGMHTSKKAYRQNGDTVPFSNI